VRHRRRRLLRCGAALVHVSCSLDRPGRGVRTGLDSMAYAAWDLIVRREVNRVGLSPASLPPLPCRQARQRHPAALRRTRGVVRLGASGRGAGAARKSGGCRSTVVHAVRAPPGVRAHHHYRSLRWQRRPLRRRCPAQSPHRPAFHAGAFSPTFCPAHIPRKARVLCASQHLRRSTAAGCSLTVIPRRTQTSVSEINLRQTNMQVAERSVVYRRTQKSVSQINLRATSMQVAERSVVYRTRCGRLHPQTRACWPRSLLTPRNSSPRQRRFLSLLMESLVNQSVANDGHFRNSNHHFPALVNQLGK
jgi:hypothetical protein